MALVYKVLGAAEWAEAERAGVFYGAEIDHRDGYIHLSSGEQLVKTVSLYFADRDDLVLVALDAEAFGDTMKWEPSRGGALFPHLYAALPVERAVSVRPFSSRDLRAVEALLRA